MTIVKELNELAKKMTGTNPKARTDAQALDYIEQHYQGGQPSPTPQSKFDYIIPKGLYDDITGEITNQNIIDVLDEIENNFLDENGNVKPLNIGAYVDNDNVQKESFTNWVQYYKNSENKLIIIIYSCLDEEGYLYIYKDNNKWQSNFYGA